MNFGTLQGKVHARSIQAPSTLHSFSGSYWTWVTCKPDLKKGWSEDVTFINEQVCWLYLTTMRIIINSSFVIKKHTYSLIQQTQIDKGMTVRTDPKTQLLSVPP